MHVNFIELILSFVFGDDRVACHPRVDVVAGDDVDT